MKPFWSDGCNVRWSVSVQKFRLKDNFVGRDPVEPQPFGHLGSIVELEHRKRRAIAKFRSAVGVDVIHHKADLFLAVEAQIPAFWKDSADPGKRDCSKRAGNEGFPGDPFPGRGDWKTRFHYPQEEWETASDRGQDRGSHTGGGRCR